MVKKSTIENDNGLVSIRNKGKGKRTIVEVSSTYPTTMILSLLISSITFVLLSIRYLIKLPRLNKNILEKVL